MGKVCMIILLLVLRVFDGHSQDHKYSPNELIVQLQYRANIDDFIQTIGKNHPEWMIATTRLLSRRLNIWLVGFETKNVLAETVLGEIRSCSAIALAQLNHTGIRLRSIPDDPLFSNQWDMNNNGVNGTVAGADISAIQAWDISTGGVTAKGDTIVVAVIDGGFDLNHEDLDFFRNYNEIPGNSIDDDNNGYSDDVQGWNAIDNNGDVGYQGFWDQHGTHVSGTVGANGNNSKGLTGVNWNVKILPVAGSSSDEAEVVAAYSYVLEMRFQYDSTGGTRGAYVVSTNSSFGVDYGQPADYPIWCAMYDSMGAYGIVSAGATANSNVNVDTQGDIPTACASSFLITVTNTNSSDQKVNSAGYGVTTIDIGAPGDDIWSTIPPGNYEGNGWSGTSMATPHVAGAIALMYSAACDSLYSEFGNDPAGLALLMRNYLVVYGFDSVPSLQGKTVTGGRLNLHKCLLAIQGDPACDTSSIGIKEQLEAEFSAIIYPNPARQEVTIHIQGMTGYKDIGSIGGNRDITFAIHDVFGRKILNRNLKNCITKLAFDNISSGIYSYRILCPGDKRMTGKLIIHE